MPLGAVHKLRRLGRGKEWRGVRRFSKSIKKTTRGSGSKVADFETT